MRVSKVEKRGEGVNGLKQARTPKVPIEGKWVGKKGMKRVTGWL